MDELKPCPFCDGIAAEDADGCCDYNGHEHQDYWIECACGAKVSVLVGDFKGSDFPCSCCHDIRAACIAKWNRRAPIKEAV